VAPNSANQWTKTNAPQTDDEEPQGQQAQNQQSNQQEADGEAQ
jgi:hypothetical protein